MNIKSKLTSRKFLVAVAGIISGAVLIASGAVEEGVTTVVASVVGYLAAEGIIDLAAVNKKAETQYEDGDDCGYGITD